MTQLLSTKFTAMNPFLNERSRRRWAAVEAKAIGRGGIERVAEATGMSRTTIRTGIKELDTPVEEPLERDGNEAPGREESF